LKALTGARWTNEAQPRNRPERQAAVLLGSRRALRAGIRSLQTLAVIEESPVITFARAHKIALWTEFVVVALSVMAMAIASHFRWAVPEESWGWMTLFGSLPWSIAATEVPSIFGLVIIAVGLGFNVVLATIVICYFVSWWLKTLRYNNDG
jgi:hypothetical protein